MLQMLEHFLHGLFNLSANLLFFVQFIVFSLRNFRDIVKGPRRSHSDLVFPLFNSQFYFIMITNKRSGIKFFIFMFYFGLCIMMNFNFRLTFKGDQRMNISTLIPTPLGPYSCILKTKLR